MSTEENKIVVRCQFDLIQRGDLTRLSKLGQMLEKSIGKGEQQEKQSVKLVEN